MGSLRRTAIFPRVGLQQTLLPPYGGGQILGRGIPSNNGDVFFGAEAASHLADPIRRRNTNSGYTP